MPIVRTILHTMADFEKELESLNARFKSAKLRVAVFVRSNHLWLRATLPPRPHSEKTKPYQQNVSTGAKATVAGLNYAERRAKYMSLCLDEGRFDWNEWIAPKVKTIGEVVEAYHDWRLKQSKIAASTFEVDYLRVSKKLPFNQKLDVEVLLDVIGKTEPDTRVRKRVAEYCRRLGKFGRIPDDDLGKISAMIGNYSASKVNPRGLPLDEEIAVAVNRFLGSDWGWLLGVIATYGLRSHEAFQLKVLDGKTGERIVRPLYPEWASEWLLWEMRPPSLNASNNAQLSSKVASWFAKRKVGFRALDLRHCYARRCFEFGIEPDRAAFMMGHSLNVHMTTYRAWFDEEVYDKVYQNAVENPSRPLPPIS